MSKFDTGELGEMAFGFKARKVNMMRGNRQGNNALVEDPSHKQQTPLDQAMHMIEWVTNAFRGDVVEKETLKAIQTAIGNEAFEKLADNIVPSLLELGCKRALLALMDLTGFRDVKPEETFFNPFFRMLLTMEAAPEEYKADDYRQACNNKIVHPIHLAALNTSGEALKWIVATTAPLELLYKTRSGLSVAHFAAVCENDVNLRYIVDQGVELEVKETDNQRTPLLWALRANKPLGNIEFIVEQKGAGSLKT